MRVQQGEFANALICGTCNFGPASAFARACPVYRAATAGGGRPSLPIDPSDPNAPDLGLFDISNGFTRVAIVSMDDLPPDPKGEACWRMAG